MENIFLGKFLVLEINLLLLICCLVPVTNKTMSPKANECKKSLDDQPAPLDSGKSDPASQPETMVSVSPAKKMVVKAHELKVICIF